MAQFVSNPISVRLTAPAESYRRADLAFHGIDHSKASYEGRIFLNNSDAQVDTPKDRDHGYAGSFWVFGHGGCAGDEGHCEVPETLRPFDFRPEHQLTAISVNVIVTEALQTMVEPGVTFTVSVVPSVRQEHAEGLPEGLVTDLLHFDRVDLLTYQ
jgi:hypothetical protein